MDAKVGQNLGRKAISSFAWKFAERLIYYAVQFLVQIALARILAPSDFGTIAIVFVFINLMNVFVQSGLNTALVQAKDVSKEDYSTVFWIGVVVATGCYAAIYVGAPAIAGYYGIEELTPILRVMSLLLYINSFNAVQVAIVMRELKTRFLMRATLFSCVISGVVGLGCAWCGAGVWSLVAQQLVFQTASCGVLAIQVRWRPRPVFSLKRAKRLFGFGWKLLVSSLLDTVYQGFYNLAIGKVFSSAQLGLYSQGDKLPSAFCTIFDNSTKTVLLSVASKVQDDIKRIKSVTRKAMMLSTFAVAPIMVFLALFAEPIITLLFGEKWVPAVPFMQLMCVAYAFWPVHTSNLQALNAIGKSDVFLKLEVLKKAIGFAILFIMLGLKCDLTIVIGGKVAGSLLSMVVNAHPAKRYFGYSFAEQLRDIFPAYGFSCAGLLAACAVSLLITGDRVFCYAVQAVVFAVVYISAAAVTHSRALSYLIDFCKPFFRGKGSR